MHYKYKAVNSYEAVNKCLNIREWMKMAEKNKNISEFIQFRQSNPIFIH